MTEATDPTTSSEAAPTGRWALAAQASDAGREARLTLAAGFWYPCYAWLRTSGVTPEESKRRLEAVTADFIETPPANPLPCLRDHLLRAVENAGPDIATRSPRIPIDITWAEKEFANEPAKAPKQVFERRWVLTVLEFTLDQLESAYADMGKTPLYLQLQPYLGFSTADENYDAIGASIGQKASEARVTVYELRKFYRATLRAQIGQTVLHADSIDPETTAMLCILD